MFIFSLDEELSRVLSGCRKCFGILSTLEAPSLSGVYPVSRVYPSKFCVEGLSIEKLSSFWGLCRLELPSEMFTCYLFAICFSYVRLEEGFVIDVHIPNLCVFQYDECASSLRTHS